MVCLKNVLAVLLITVSVVNLEPMVRNANSYGPYDLFIERYGTCKGPKAKNLTIVALELKAEQQTVTINMTFLDDAKIDEIKVQVFSIKDNKKNFLWNYKLNEPCKHFAVATMIEQNVNAKNCLVKKGDYSNDVHFGEVMNSFLGKSFFFGSYAYKADIISKKGNIACFSSILTFKKKLEN